MAQTFLDTDTTQMYDVSTNRSAEPVHDNRPDPEQVSRLLWIYLTPVILVVGILGNLSVVLVLRHFWRNASQAKSNGARTVTVYLAVMAVADVIFLVSGQVPEWLTAMGYVTIGDLHPATCKAEKFIFYTSGDVAIWIICALNLDRFIAICFPLRKNMPCVRSCLRHPIYLSMGITLFACAKNIHVIWTRGRVRDDDGEVDNCGRPEPYEHFELYIRPWIVFFLVSLVPTIILIICNTGIIITLKRAEKLRLKMSHSASAIEV